MGANAVTASVRTVTNLIDVLNAVGCAIKTVGAQNHEISHHPRNGRRVLSRIGGGAAGDVAVQLEAGQQVVGRPVIAACSRITLS